MTRDGDQDGGSLGAGVNRQLLLMAHSPPKELKCQRAVLRISMASEGPALTVLLCAFQNECMKIWSLLRSGKFSCPTSKELVRSPDGKADLNKCLMCQRLM